MKDSSFTMLKSALKKSSALDICSERRVSFSKTVQIYGNSLKPECVPDKYEENTNDSSIGIELFSIETMIQAMTTDAFDCNLNEDPSDFFVHKVVYDDEDQLNNSSEDLKIVDVENQELSPNSSDAENEEFIVHQVSLHEDGISDLSELSNTIQEKPKEETIGELSIQNIEHHNKLTESQLLLECEINNSIPMPSNVLNSSEIILSPPLQELGVNRLICPQSDKWFWNLDISPLNSVHESDSESNVSSEDTMIMMTSEECAKNEQKIQESLQKFEYLKKQNNKDKSDLIPEHRPCLNECNLSSSIKNVKIAITHVSSNCTAFSCSGDTSTDVVSSETVELKIYDSENTLDNATSKNNVTVEKTSSKCLSSHLIAVEIPKDVREWKIPIDKGQIKKEFNRDDDVTDKKIDLNSLPNSASFNVVELAHQTNNSLNASENYMDELEHFVDQCTERVERIRKRYSINENMLWTPRRGIKPRFGSSTAILQHFSSGNHPLLSSININNSHYSWPYYISDDHQEKHKLMKPHSTSLLTNFVDNVHETSHKSPCAENISVGGLQQFFKDNARNGTNWSLTNELVNTESSFDERNYSKNACLFNPLPESVSDSKASKIKDGSESIVYYSMQV